MCTVISYYVMQPLSLWEKAALSPDEYVAGRAYKCITNSPFALLCMSGYVCSHVTPLRKSVEGLLVPRDVSVTP